jgi:osmotically-inducible protein OsmY
MVVDAARSEEIKACGIDSVYLLGKLSLHRKVESALLDAGVTDQHLFFNVEDADSVQLYGFTHSLEEKENVERILKGIKDIRNIKNDLTVYNGYLSGL